MNAAQAREVFDSAAAAAPTTEARASIELAREYFCNPEFRKALQDYVWMINQGKEAA